MLVTKKYHNDVVTQLESRLKAEKECTKMYSDQLCEETLAHQETIIEASKFADRVQTLEGDNDSLRKSLEKARLALVDKDEEIKDLKKKLDIAYDRLFQQKEKKPVKKVVKKRKAANGLRNIRRSKRSDPRRA